MILDRRDVLVQFTFLPTNMGGRKGGFTGYKPAHMMPTEEPYLTTGMHEYTEADRINPGDNGLGYIQFLSPEYYPHCLHIGDYLQVQEGGHIVGWVKILEILNPLLAAK